MSHTIAQTRDPELVGDLENSPVGGRWHPPRNVDGRRFSMRSFTSSFGFTRLSLLGSLALGGAAFTGCVAEAPSSTTYAVTECSEHDTCVAGASCRVGLCLDACGADLDCPAGTACVGGSCFASRGGACMPIGLAEVRNASCVRERARASGSLAARRWHHVESPRAPTSRLVAARRFLPARLARRALRAAESCAVSP